MLRSKKFFWHSVAAFIIAELVLGVLVQLTSALPCKIISFVSVLLACLFFALFYERNCKYIFTQFGLILTVCADVFLVLLDARQKLAAMILFLVAQLFYARRIYLYSEGDSVKRAHILTRFLLIAAFLASTAIVLGSATDALALVSVVYYANLLVNILFAFADGRRSLVFAFGLLLFSLCDAVVGLSLIDAYLPVAQGSLVYRLTHTELSLAWIFYVPSQTLIALSTAFSKKSSF